VNFILDGLNLAEFVALANFFCLTLAPRHPLFTKATIQPGIVWDGRTPFLPTDNCKPLTHPSTNKKGRPLQKAGAPFRQQSFTNGISFTQRHFFKNCVT
jgi:hypothetical protein